jgi:hypothetical protein
MMKPHSKHRIWLVSLAALLALGCAALQSAKDGLAQLAIAATATPHDQGGEADNETPGGSRSIPECAADVETPYFGRSPIAVEDLLGIVPLGNLNPPGHTFPTDHIYFFLGRSDPQDPAGAPAETALYAPGHIWITSVVFVEHLYADPPFTDYTIRFSPCRQIEAYFMHVSSLSEELLSRVGPQQEATCRQYSAGGQRYGYCERWGLEIEVQQGEIIGTAGGRAGQNALDMGAMDARLPALGYANPARIQANPSGLDQLHVVCPIDYFEAETRRQLRSMLGDWSGERRTVEPLCGEVMQDVPGTAQGKWYLRGTVEPFPEDPHLALVHDNVDPGYGVLSAGTSVPGLDADTYYFLPQDEGAFNLDFSLLTPGDSVHCYGEFSNYPGQPGEYLDLKLMVQLTPQSILRVEMQQGGECGVGPFSFGSSLTEFER